MRHVKIHQDCVILQILLAWYTLHVIFYEDQTELLFSIG